MTKSRSERSRIAAQAAALSALLAIGTSVSSHAAEAASGTADEDLDELVVTGSRIVRDGVTAPTPVTVV